MLKNQYNMLGLLIVLIISFLVFYYSYIFQVWQATNTHWVSDVPDHSQLILDFAKRQNFPVYSLWYRLIYVLSGFSEKYSYIAYVSIILLTGLVAAKYLITHIILATTRANKKNIALISSVLIFVMPVVSYYTSANKSLWKNSFHFYLGNIAPNQWHNSTLILAMPFNLLLFYYSVKRIHSEGFYSYFVMGIISIISLLCKPNFALAFLPILCMNILILNIKAQQYLRGLIKCSLVAIPSILTLLYQWYFTFVQNNLFPHHHKTIIAPFLVWSAHSPHIPLSLFLSIAFPLLILILYFKEIDFYLILSWLTFLVALSMLVFIAEYPKWSSGNYFWGAIAANYILFLFSVRFLLNQPIYWKSKVAYVVFGVHFLSGIFYLGCFFIKQTSLLL